MIHFEWIRMVICEYFHDFFMKKQIYFLLISKKSTVFTKEIDTVYNKTKRVNFIYFQNKLFVKS